ncbi:hypothetical protein CPC08DRAFT_724963 [Agrocybe pediades]|nr:hypothetical protein CPC08DRAFT_724963 [Agrocybe pediades]
MTDLLTALVQGMRELEVLRYTRLFSNAIMLYDHMVTFGEEVRLMWGGTWSLVKALFFVVSAGTRFKAKVQAYSNKQLQRFGIMAWPVLYITPPRTRLMDYACECMRIIPGPGQYLLSEFHKLIKPLQNQGNATPKFTLHWISAHTDVPGNEKVDEEAKAAAQGNSTPKLFLPSILQRPLPTSKSALLQTTWETSPRRKKLKKIEKEIPFKKYIKFPNELTRRQTSMLIQIRTGHFPLNDYLFKRRLVNSPLCTACIQDQRETLDHIIKDCPAYRTQRSTLKKAIQRRGLNDPRSLLSNPKFTKAILHFIQATGRWTSGRMVNHNP